MSHLTGKTIAILATDGFEQSELLEPKRLLEAHGAHVDVISSDGKQTIRGWKEKNWGDEVKVDVQLSDADASRYDALVLPGGVINPDTLRRDKQAISFIQTVDKAGKPVAAICHGPWLLAESGLAKDRRLTSWASIKTDLINAGGKWEDAEVVTDGNIITSRKPDDIPAFSEAIAQALTA